MSRKKYWDINSEEYHEKKEHLINYLMGNKGNIKQVERERALELGDQLDDESFIEYVESLDSKFNKQYKAAFRKYKSSHPLLNDSHTTCKSKPVRLSTNVQVQLDHVIKIYKADNPEQASKANSKAELLENALDHLIFQCRNQ